MDRRVFFPETVPCSRCNAVAVGMILWPYRISSDPGMTGIAYCPKHEAIQKARQAKRQVDIDAYIERQNKKRSAKDADASIQA